MMHFLHQTR